MSAAVGSESVVRAARLGVAALALTLASIHVAILNEHLQEQTYVGALFLAGILGLQVVALQLAQSRRDRVLDTAAWTLGVFIAVAMSAFYVASRTAGLPGYHEPWDRIGVASLVVEGALVALAATAGAASDLSPSRAWTGTRTAA